MRLTTHRASKKHTSPFPPSRDKGLMLHAVNKIYDRGGDGRILLLLLLSSLHAFFSFLSSSRMV